MTIPAWLEENWWLIEKLEPWFTDGSRRGNVLLEFRYGSVRPTFSVLDESIKIKSAQRAEPDPRCPDCSGMTVERDYGAKAYCDKCDRTWPRWKVEKGKQTTDC